MYQLLLMGGVLRLADNTYIPTDPANTDYQLYLAWIAEGNTPEPADPPPAPDYSAMRKVAYVVEADPIFFMSQRGEATQQQWLDKVAEIKARWPA